MNIANIFGMYLGCNVKIGGSIGKLVSVGGDYGLVGVKENKSYHDDYVEYQIIDCKLLLTPLSKITEEDKREFQDKFLLKNRKIRHFQNTMYGTTIYFAESEIFTDRAGCNNEMAFWLASKGYDIGICPKEYKEIVE